MTAAAATDSPLLRFALEGQRVRKASAVLERIGPKLASALRRAVPFLSRRGVAVEISQVRAMPLEDLLASLAKPTHTTHFVTQPGLSPGALILDAGATSLFLDGVLGGDGASLPALNPAGLSGPQTALVSGLAANILRGFSGALQTALGLTLEPKPPSEGSGHSEGAPVVCILELGDGAGRIALVVGRDPLLTEQADGEEASGPEDNPRIAAVLADVELLLVVELGRVPMRVGQLAALRVGDTLKLDVPVNGLVSVRSDGHELMRGRPTSSGGRIAVNIIPSGGGLIRHGS
jgi:flagellar motor switch protein FliM